MAHSKEKLPFEIKNRVLRGINYSATERNELFDKFVEKLVKLTSEAPEQFTSFINLNKTLDKKKNKFINTKNATKKLTRGRRKELGLYVLGKKTIKYAELIPLHELWKDYMTDYMNLDNLRWSNNPEDPNFDTVTQKLFRADFHGSYLTVIRSKCHTFVGKNGIVIMETKNSFKLLGKDNIIRTIPKASCAFEFNLKEFQFTFYGKNFQIRPAERSSKKLKSSYVGDL